MLMSKSINNDVKVNPPTVEPPCATTSRKRPPSLSDNLSKTGTIVHTKTITAQKTRQVVAVAYRRCSFSDLLWSLCALSYLEYTKTFSNKMELHMSELGNCMQ